jgi:hypothetical protein
MKNPERKGMTVRTRVKWIGVSIGALVVASAAVGAANSAVQVTGSPAAPAGPAAVPTATPSQVGTPSVVNSAPENSQVDPGAVAVRLDVAEEILGLSDLEVGSYEYAVRMYFDEGTSTAWATVYADQESLIERALGEGEPVVFVDGAIELPADSIVIRVSDYTEAQIGAARTEVEALATAHALSVAFDYNPVIDAIDAYGDAEGIDLLGAEIGGVRVRYEPGTLERASDGGIDPALVDPSQMGRMPKIIE